jgi:hypothetical protein
MEEIHRLNGTFRPHQTIPPPSTMHPSSLPPSRSSNHPSRQGPPPARAPNPRQNRQSGPSIISPPVMGARVKRTFQRQVHRRMEDVQCYNCKELGHPLKYCTVFGDHRFLYGCPQCNAGHLYDSYTNGKKRTNDDRHYLVQLRDGLCPIASNIERKISMYQNLWNIVST